MLDFNCINTEEIKELVSICNIHPYKLTTIDKNFLKKHKVYISMSTNPIRLIKIPSILNLLDLTNIYEIHINLPKYYRNNKNEIYNKNDIDFIKKIDSKIKVFTIEKDIGPLTKIIPTIKRVNDNNAIIISIDDDIGYPYDMVSKLIHYSVKKPKQILCGAGFSTNDYPNSDFNRKLLPNKKLPKYPLIDIVEGWGAVAYKKSIVSEKIIKQIMKLNDISTECKLSDDFTISYILAENGIKCSEVPGIRENLIPLEYGEGEDALHKGSGVKKSGSEDENMEKYHKCLDDISKSRHNRRSKKKTKI